MISAKHPSCLQLQPHPSPSDAIASLNWRRMALDASSGYVAPSNLTDSTDALPMFDVQRVQLQFPIAADFVAAQVANNVLILALSTGRILRIDLESPEDIDGKRGVCIGRRSAVPVPLTISPYHYRYRPSQEIRRDRPHPSLVPRSLSVPFDHYHHPRRELLPPHPITTAEAPVAAKRHFDREHRMEPVFPDCFDQGDITRYDGWNRVRDLHRAVD